VILLCSHEGRGCDLSREKTYYGDLGSCALMGALLMSSFGSIMRKEESDCAYKVPAAMLDSHVEEMDWEGNQWGPKESKNIVNEYPPRRTPVICSGGREIGGRIEVGPDRDEATNCLFQAGNTLHGCSGRANADYEVLDRLLIHALQAPYMNPCLPYNL